jgi:4-hydroxy-3-methylbut-2-enyl diphosphate reductase
MLMSESLAIGEMLRQAMTDRYGQAQLPARFRAFDTICSATQERQDAVVALLEGPPLDLAIVIGGYNSSNTCSLARICADRVPTYHIADADCLESARQIRHRPVGVPSTVVVPEARTDAWLPSGRVRLGLTAGASTPNNIIGRVIERLEALADEPIG